MSVSSDRLLCEACGYPIDGMDVARVCPECGRAVGESLPGRRAGSPWQQQPGVRAWTRTALGVLRSPRGGWAAVRVERPRAFALLITNISVASVTATIALLPGPVWRPPVRYVTMFFLVHFLLVLALSAVEYAGIRLLGKRHGYRVTSEVATAVCAHASVGWVISGIAVAAAAQILQRVGTLWNGSMGFRGGGNVGVLIAGAAILAAFALGMIVYSTLCGVGYRAMRFANR